LSGETTTPPPERAVASAAFEISPLLRALDGLTVGGRRQMMVGLSPRVFMQVPVKFVHLS